ncbi:MAG: helix-turn-helix domain-containing protein [Candidatus Methylomirabilales bacterium]
MRGEGKSWREVARQMNLPRSTVYRYRGTHILHGGCKPH